MTNPAIEVDHLTKSYRLYKSPKDRLREFVSPSRKKYHHVFHALSDVSFSVAKGETVGIIGQNGSGKSTLLKIICGVVRPTSGSVKANGRISSLLELGAGFHPEFTGRDNVYMNGALEGFSREEMDRRFPEIEAFAEIGEFIDQPVKTYSSGMFVRLAFSSAIHVDPEILIVDEALSVGDMFFQSKCVVAMKKMLDRGITLLFVSHDLGALKSLCGKSILLRHGEIRDFDATDKVVEKYFSIKVGSEQETIKPNGSIEVVTLKENSTLKDQQQQVFRNPEFQKRAVFQRIQNGKVSFENIQLLNDKEEEVVSVDYQQRVTLRMAIEVFEDVPTLGFGYHIRDKNGVDIVYSDSVIEHRNLQSLKKSDKYIVDWEFKVSLAQGPYNIACVLSIPIENGVGRVEFCDFVPLAVQFTVLPRIGSCLYGGVHWENDVDVRRIKSGTEV